MKKNLARGTEEFEFFKDFYSFLSESYEPEQNEEYYQKLIDDSEILLKKYEKCKFYQLAKGLILVVAIYLGEIKGKKTDGRWTISYK